MSRNIVPRVNKGADLGTSEKNWNRLYTDAITLRGSDLKTTIEEKVDSNMLTAKGDLYVATGPGAITRLPMGVDGYVLRSNSLKAEGLEWTSGDGRQPLLQNITVTVGSGGEFSTINQAINSITSLYYPKYIPGIGTYKATIRLLPNFIMSEQVFVNSINLSWIEIMGDDAETIINRSALVELMPDNYPAFLAYNGGFLPIINQLFNMDTSGDSYGRHGIFVSNNSNAIILPHNGIKNAGHFGIYASNNSNITARFANASGAGEYGIYAAWNSSINAESANASGAGIHGFNIYEASFINAIGATGTIPVTANTLTANGIIFA